MAMTWYSQWSLRCDFADRGDNECQEYTDADDSKKQVKQDAKDMGWFVTNELVLCPFHRDATFGAKDVQEVNNDKNENESIDCDE